MNTAFFTHQETPIVTEHITTTEELFEIIREFRVLRKKQEELTTAFQDLLHNANHNTCVDTLDKSLARSIVKEIEDFLDMKEALDEPKETKTGSNRRGGTPGRGKRQLQAPEVLSQLPEKFTVKELTTLVVSKYEQKTATAFVEIFKNLGLVEQVGFGTYRKL